MHRLLVIGIAISLGAGAFACDKDWLHDLPPEIQRIAHRTMQEKEKESPQTAPHESQANAPKPDAKLRKELDDDIAMGKEIAGKVAKELKMSTSQPMVDRVRRIGKELSEVANQVHVIAPWGEKRFTQFDYTFEVLEGNDVNAFSIPGGFIYIYEGLIKYAETDHELAGVIAHEIAHASFRHVATLQREYSKMQAVTLPLILISLLTGTDSGQKVAMGTNLLEQAVGSGWSIKAEKAADFGGLEYLYRSKYSPVGMLTFMERLAFDERNQMNVDWGIFRTHPPNKERARDIYNFLMSRDVKVSRSLTSTTFRAMDVEELDLSHSIKVLGKRIVTFSGDGAAARSNEAAIKLNTFFDSVPRLFEVELRGATLYGRGEALFTVHEHDAKAKNLTTEEYAKQVMTELKAAVFDLSYRTLIQG